MALFGNTTGGGIFGLGLLNFGQTANGTKSGLLGLGLLSGLTGQTSTGTSNGLLGLGLFKLGQQSGASTGLFGLGILGNLGAQSTKGGLFGLGLLGGTGTMSTGGINCTISGIRTSMANQLTTLHDTIYQNRRSIGTQEWGSAFHNTVKTVRLFQPCVTGTSCTADADCTALGGTCGAAGTPNAGKCVDASGALV